MNCRRDANFRWILTSTASKSVSAQLILSGFLVAFAVLVWPAAIAFSQEAPGESQIQKALVLELPPWWSVERVEIQAAVNDGDAVEPLWRQRFVAEAVPAEALYAQATDDEAVAPFRVLIPTRSGTVPTKLYGISRSRLERGEWITELDLENTVVEAGLPASFFDGPVVVANTEQASQVAASLAQAREFANTVREIRSRESIDSDALARLSEETAAALDAANLRRQQALRERYEAERNALAGAAEAERAILVEENRARLEALKASLAEERAGIEGMAAEAEAERAGLLARSQESLDALEAQYEAERAALLAAGEAERVELARENQARLEVLQAELAAESAPLESEVEAMEAERIRLISESEAALEALKAKHERERAAFAAANEVLLEASKAEAEAAAKRRLAAEYQALAEEKRREAAIAGEVAAAAVAARVALHDVVIDGLRVCS